MMTEVGDGIERKGEGDGKIEADVGPFFVFVDELKDKKYYGNDKRNYGCDEGYFLETGTIAPGEIGRALALWN